MSDNPSKALMNKVYAFITKTDEPISGRSGLEFFIKSPPMLSEGNTQSVGHLILREDSPAMAFFGPMVYHARFRFQENDEDEAKQNYEIQRLVSHRERPQAYTQQSTSSVTHSNQGHDFVNRNAVNVASNPEETRERVQPTQQAQPAAPARRTAGAHDARLQDGLFTDMPRGTRRGTLYNVPNNNHPVEESEEEEAANTTDPVVHAQTQPGANTQVPPGQANANAAQDPPNLAPGNNPGATEPTPVPGILDDKPDMDIDYQSYQRRWKWLINKKGLSVMERELERQELEAVRLLLQDQGLLPNQTQVHTPAAASVLTLSTASKYREISEEISCKEDMDVWKIKIKRKEIAIGILKKWFSAHAQEIGRKAWDTGDPGIIFDFYFIMFAKDIPMIETLAQEQLRALTITKGQRISDFLIVFRVVINVIECLDQHPMSERNKRLALERTFVRSNYHQFRYVFHNAKMLGLSFNRTIEFIEEIENEEFQMKEVYDFIKKGDNQQKDSRDARRSGRNSNQPKPPASVNMAGTQSPRQDHQHGRGGGRGGRDGSAGRGGRGRGRNNNGRGGYQGYNGNPQGNSSQDSKPNPPTPPKQYGGQQPNRAQQQGTQAAGRDHHNAMQRQVQANPPQTPQPPRTSHVQFAQEYHGMSSSEEETNLAVVEESDESVYDSDYSYEECGMAMEGKESGSEDDREPDPKRQRTESPVDETITYEEVSDEEKSQVVQAIASSSDTRLSDMSEPEINAIGGIQNHPAVPRYPNVPPPPQPIESPEADLSARVRPRLPLIDHEPIDPVPRILSDEEQRQFGMISRNLPHWQRHFIRRYGDRRLSPEKAFGERQWVKPLDLQVMKLILKEKVKHANVLADIAEILTHYISGIGYHSINQNFSHNFSYPEYLLRLTRKIRVDGMTDRDMQSQMHSFRALRMYLLLSNVTLELAARIDSVAFHLCYFALRNYFHARLNEDHLYRPWRANFVTPHPDFPFRQPIREAEYKAMWSTFAAVWNERIGEIIEISDSDDDDNDDNNNNDHSGPSTSNHHDSRGGFEWKEPDEDEHDGFEWKAPEPDDHDTARNADTEDDAGYDDADADEVVAEEEDYGMPESMHPVPDTADEDDPFVGAIANCDVSDDSEEDPWEIVSAELGPWDAELEFPSRRNGRHRCATSEDSPNASHRGSPGRHHCAKEVTYSIQSNLVSQPLNFVSKTADNRIRSGIRGRPQDPTTPILEPKSKTVKEKKEIEQVNTDPCCQQLERHLERKPNSNFNQFEYDSRPKNYSSFDPSLTRHSHRDSVLALNYRESHVDFCNTFNDNCNFNPNGYLGAENKNLSTKKDPSVYLHRDVMRHMPIKYDEHAYIYAHSVFNTRVKVPVPDDPIIPKQTKDRNNAAEFKKNRFVMMFDTGSQVHLFTSALMLLNTRQTSRRILDVNGGAVEISTEGDIGLLENVLVSSRAPRNIISGTLLMKMGLHFYTTGDYLFICDKDDNFVSMGRRNKNNLIYMRDMNLLRDNIRDELVLVAREDVVDARAGVDKKNGSCPNRLAKYGAGINVLNLLHNRFGHLPEKKLKAIAKNGNIKGLGLCYDDIKDLHLDVCDACIRAKMRKLPVKPTESKNNEERKPFEKVGADIVGKVQVKSIHGNHYFVSMWITRPIIPLHTL
jgi:hypothetical protein